MHRQRHLVLALAAAVLLLAVGCSDDLNQSVADFNRRATELAGGDLSVVTEITVAPGLATLVPGVLATPTPGGEANTVFDLTTNPNALLVHAWGQVYALPRGSTFTIIADQVQTGSYIISQLQLAGWQQTVRGGSLTIASGQMRLDLALEDTEAAFGAGEVTFQPTLDAAGLRLNPQGADFRGLRMPNNFTAALGDAAFAALSGAPNNTLSKVNLTRLSLENGVVQISGTVR